LRRLGAQQPRTGAAPAAVGPERGTTGPEPVEAVPFSTLTSIRRIVEEEHTGIGDPPSMVVRSGEPSKRSSTAADPVPDEGRLQRRIAETVERTVVEIVERRLGTDSRFGRRLAGQMRAELYQDLVFERERLGVE
jgi:hypothetical protein